MWNKTSPRGFSASAEEASLWRHSHEIRQKQPFCECSLHPTVPTGIFTACIIILFFIPEPNGCYFSFDDQNQTYELYAVVDHVGDIRGGYYVTTVKSQDDERWYNFADTTVTLVRLITRTLHIWMNKLFNYIMFGCSFCWQLDYQPFLVKSTEKWVFICYFLSTRLFPECENDLFWLFPIRCFFVYLLFYRKSKSNFRL